MFCQNCGNKTDENAYVCINCGVVLKKRSETKIVNNKSYNKMIGYVSIILGIIALLLSILLFFNDISSVGMYTEIYERIFYAIDYSITAIMMSTVTLIFSLIAKKGINSTLGLLLSLLSFFFIITEIVVVIIY